MQIQLLDALHAQVDSSAARALVVDQDTPGVGESCASLLDLLGVGALRISDPQVSAIQAPADLADVRSFTVSGTMDVLNALGLRVIWTFFVAHDARAPADDAVHCHIQIENFPESWDIATVYPDAPPYGYSYDDFPSEDPAQSNSRNFLREISFKGMKLALSSYDFAIAARENARAGTQLFRTSLAAAPTLPGHPAELLRGGVTFGASLTLEGAFWDQVKQIRPGLNEIDVVGSISADDNGVPLLSLAHDFRDEAGRMPTLSVDPSGATTLGLQQLRVRTGLLRWSDTAPGIGILVRLGDGGWGLDLNLDLFSGNAVAMLSGAFEGGTPLTLSNLEKVLGLQDLGGDLPSPLDKLDSLGLHAFSAIMPLSPPSLAHIDFTIASDQPWVILKDVIEFAPVLQFAIDRSGDESVTEVLVGGAWQLGTTQLDIWGDPATGDVFASMAVGQRLDMTALFARLLPGVEVPKVELLDLDLAGNFEDGSFSFEIDVGTDWEVDLGGTPVTLRDLGVSGSSYGGGFAATLTGALAIGGTDATVRADMDETITVEVTVSAINVGDLADDFLRFVHLPAELPSFDLRDLDVTIVPSTGAFHISGASDTEIHVFTGFGFTVAHFDVERSSSAGAADQAGRTLAATLDLDLTLGPAHIKTTARYRSSEGQGSPAASEWQFSGALAERIPIGHLLDALESMVHLSFPLPTSGLEIADLEIAFNLGAADQYFAISCTVLSATRTYGRLSLLADRHNDPKADTPSGWSYLLNVEANLADLDIANLPLVGPQLDRLGSVKLSAIQLTEASRAYGESEVAALRLRLSDKAVHPPAGKLDGGASFALQATLPGGVKILSLPVNTGPPADTTMAQPAPGLPAPLPPPPRGRASAATKWFEIHKGAGPVTLERLGIRFADGVLTVLFDADLNLEALRFGLMGLGVSSPLDRFAPSFSLQGVSIELNAGPVSVGGGLSRTEDGAFSGIVRLDAEGLGITALGQYAKTGDAISLFAFGVLDQPLGGPPYAFVRGVAAGIGLGSALRIPTAEQVPRFSLIQAAQGASGFGGAGLTEIMGAMGEDIHPQVGAQWFAAGVRFSSFEIVQSVALLTVGLSGSPQIAILGLSHITMPPMSTDPIAFAEIGLVANIDPAGGALMAQGQLTQNSFILSHACRPTGGFAFCTWFAGAHAGDFVLSLGGYHPRFPIPAHYPHVPRLGILWRLSDHITLRGTSYFALVPHAVMAGGSIEVVFESGDIRAWFSAQYDVLIFWKPFAYFVDISVGIGVSVHVNLLFTSTTLSFHVGAALHLHGPPFGGEASVDLSVASFTISFGASHPQAPPISWSEFKTTFLPPPGQAALEEADRDANGARVTPTTAICSLRVTAGMVRDLGQQGGAAGGVDWVVNPERFSVVTACLIPSKAAFLNGAPLPDAGAKNFGIGPAAVPDAAFHSTHRIRFERYDPVAHAWRPYVAIAATPVIGNLPAALWHHAAGSRQPDLGGATLVGDLLVGFAIAPKSSESDITAAEPFGDLMFANDPPRRFDWSQHPPPSIAATVAEPADQLTVRLPQGGAPAANRDFIMSSLVHPAVTARRAEMLANLQRRGLAAGAVLDLGRMARQTFADWPRIAPVGAEAA